MKWKLLLFRKRRAAAAQSTTICGAYFKTSITLWRSFIQVLLNSQENVGIPTNALKIRFIRGQIMGTCAVAWLFPSLFPFLYEE